MSRARKYRRGARIKTMAALSKELDNRRYVYLYNKPMHHGWMRSMTWQTLRFFINGGRVRKATENKLP